MLMKLVWLIAVFLISGFNEPIAYDVWSLDFSLEHAKVISGGLIIYLEAINPSNAQHW